MKKVSLPDLINFLHAQKAEDFLGSTVESYLRTHHLEQDDFLPFIFFREDTYARNLVYRSNLFELMVLTWLPRQCTPIHEHGGHRCWTLVQSGALHVRTYAPSADHDFRLVPNGTDAVRQAGDSVHIDDSLGLHSIANRSSRPAISVHLYAAPLPRCRVYDEKSETFNWVELEYFTQFEMESNIEPRTF